jgi:hypothetical protein
MMALPPAELGRLAKIAGMFGSDHAGGRAAAAAQTDCIVHAVQMSWPDVLDTNLRPAVNSETSWRRELSPATILAIYGQALSGCEKCFLTGLLKRAGWIKNQIEVIYGIRARVS